MFKKLFSILSFCLLLTGCTDFFSIPEGQLNLDAERLAKKNYCIAFYSTKKFTLSTNQTSKSWNGTLYYSTDTLDWYEWDGSKITAGDTNTIYIRGKNNTFITGEETNNHFVLSGKKAIYSCGNILNILNFPEVMENKEPFMASYCFNNLFKGNTNLETTPELPAVQLSSYCYSGLFEGCKNIKKAPELPARVLTAGCYSRMFVFCTSLENSPVLRSENLAERCYEYMFYASGLKNAPELPAQIVYNYSYANMFALCNNLKSCPELKATTLAEHCYESMFSECSNLENIPELSAKYLTPFCYKKMFYKCINITELPVLQNLIIAESCFESMFENCTSIKLYEESISDKNWKMTRSGTNNSDNNWNLNMIKNTTGGYSDNPNFDIQYYYSDSNFEKIAKEKNYLVFLGSEPFTLTSDKTWNGIIEYSFDSENWNEWDGSIINTLDGINKNVIYLRGENNTVITGESVNKGMSFNNINTLSYIKCYGNIETLLDYKKVEKNIHPKMDDYCFFKLFCKNNINNPTNYIIIPPELPATELTKACYSYMFVNTYLKKMPELPATKLAEECYKGMFYNCINLESISNLPAKRLTQSCYESMFEKCWKLHEISNNFTFTFADINSCKYMFSNTNLVLPPSLPATTIEQSCYEKMFYNCKYLREAPVLPAKEIKYRSYANMFSYCDSLTYVPDINADTVDVQGCMKCFILARI